MRNGDRGGRTGWVPTRVVIDYLTISRVSLRRLMGATPRKAQIWRDITLGGRRPEYRWKFDKLDDWFLDVTRHGPGIVVGGKARSTGHRTGLRATGTRRAGSRLGQDAGGREDLSTVPKTFRPNKG